MPNYLERVVTAGARTDTLVGPAVAAPPLLPGFDRLWLPPSELAEMDLAPLDTLQEGERSTSREPVPPVPAHSALPAMSAAQPTRQDAGAHEVRTLIQAPTTLRPASQPATERVTTEPPSPLASRPAPSHRPSAAAPRPQPQPGEEAESSQPVTDIARFRQTAMAADSSATEGALDSLQPHTQLLQEQVTAPPTMRPAPIWQAPSASLPHSSSGHQSRITIGRIDVQVNNHPPVIPSSPPPIAGALPLDNLETRFLNRFPIRP
jgi:hypothetical protein